MSSRPTDTQRLEDEGGVLPDAGPVPYLTLDEQHARRLLAGPRPLRQAHGCMPRQPRSRSQLHTRASPRPVGAAGTAASCSAPPDLRTSTPTGGRRLSRSDRARSPDSCGRGGCLGSVCAAHGFVEETHHRRRAPGNRPRPAPAGHALRLSARTACVRTAGSWRRTCGGHHESSDVIAAASSEQQ